MRRLVLDQMRDVAEDRFGDHDAVDPAQDRHLLVEVGQRFAFCFLRILLSRVCKTRVIVIPTHQWPVTIRNKLGALRTWRW